MTIPLFWPLLIGPEAGGCATRVIYIKTAAATTTMMTTMTWTWRTASRMMMGGWKCKGTMIQSAREPGDQHVFDEGRGWWTNEFRLYKIRLMVKTLKKGYFRSNIVAAITVAAPLSKIVLMNWDCGEESRRRWVRVRLDHNQNIFI